MQQTDGIGEHLILGEHWILPKKTPQICLFQTNLASQVHAHAIAAFLLLESHSGQVIHILCQGKNGMWIKHKPCKYYKKE